MKICLVSQEYPPETGGGGIGTQTFLKAHGLSARGHEIHVVSSSADSRASTKMDRLATIHRMAAPELAAPGFEISTYWLAYSAAVARKLTELTKTIPFDIIQYPEYGGEGFVYQTDTFTYRSARYVVQLHGPLAMFVEHMGWPERGSTLDQVGCMMERTVVHHADRLLASSHTTAAFVAKAYGADLPKIRVIHSAVNTARFMPKQRPDGPGSPRILFVGNMAGNKGATSLIDAVLRLRGRFPDIRLRTIGKGDAGVISDLKKTVANADAGANIEFLGYVPYEELPDQYAWCDMFAGPSIYEPGPGNVYLEAMASGRPVIACTTGGAPEVVLDGKTGLLVPPSDSGSLGDAIATLAQDYSLRERLGREGRAWIESNFTFERYTDKVETIYRELVK